MLRCMGIGLFMALAMAATGCGGSGLYEVAGTVNFKGKPLPSGRIEFQGPSAAGSAVITDGKYRLPAEQGLPPGKYKVLVTSVGAAPQAKNIPPGSEPLVEPKEPIPETYNSKTTLSYEVVGSSRTADFDLK
jgi:hypothetical protein